ncbi:MAG TPA: universal stress protein, partial [Acidimicrobiia bacterium]|nr:universal stress protein [Acidimicrobiia bacterium]
AVAGLKVNIVAIFEPRLLLITLAVIGVATFGKVTGAYLGARLVSKQPHWTALAYGSGLNARGAVEIIIASIGLSLGVLSVEMFSIIVVMAVVTSLMAPIALRYTIARTDLGEEEQARLRKEAALGTSFLGEVRRVLVPVRPGAGIGHTRELQVSILNRLASLQDMAVTLVAVAGPEEKVAAARHLSELERLFDVGKVRTRVITTATDPVEAILVEAERDYDLMVLGTPSTGESSDSLFGPLIDDLIKLSPCPTLLTRGVARDERMARILVPTNGTAAARRAAELAFAIANENTEIEGLHVVTPSLVGASRDLSADVTAELEVVGDAMGKTPHIFVRRDDSAETGILAYIEESDPDLLILGTEVRAGTIRLHLGPRVENLVRTAPCPVVVLNS